jgi:CheY-like chemotaxis protein
VIDLTGLRVLVVEDNALNQRLVERILQDANMMVEIAGNGKAAVDMVTARAYDFVLMDMQMPVMDGYEAASIIRNKLKSEVPIIAMTAHALHGEKEKCLRLGMDDYIAKPIKTSELFEKLSRIRGAEVRPATGLEIEPGKTNSMTPDFTYLMEATGGNDEFILELLVLCMKSIPEDMSLLRKSVESMDLPQVNYYSHKMRSSSTLAGVLSLTESLKAMELISVEEGDGVKALPALLEATEELVSYALQVIETEIANRSNLIKD